MTYTHLSTDELVIIESYFHQNASVSKISEQIGRARQTVHNVVTFLKDGHTALDFYKRYKANKQRYQKENKRCCRMINAHMWQKRSRKDGRRM